MKVKYKDLNNAALVAAFNEIKKTQLPVTAAYRFGKIADKLDSIVSEFQVRYVELMKANAVKDEAGEPVLVKDDDGKILGYKIEESKQAHVSEVYTSMLNEEVELGVNPVEFKDLEKAFISPNTIMALEPFIVGA